MAVAADGTLCIADTYNVRIRRIRPSDGTITTVAGGGTSSCTGKDCPALKVNLSRPVALSMGSDGSIYVASGAGNGTIFKLSAASPRLAANEALVASPDGSEIYVFDGAGRHQRTLDAMTGAVRLSFTYDAAGRLSAIADATGNVTSIERDAQGNPSAIVAPFGQRTVLAVDANGYPSQIAGPGSQNVLLRYAAPVAGVAHSGGLLIQLTDPRNGVHSFDFDDSGFLTSDADATGATQRLDRNGSLQPDHVTHTSPMGRVTDYRVTPSAAGDAETVTVTDGRGLTTTTQRNGDFSTSEKGPDGTVTTETPSADPRFGMAAPVVSSSVRLPSGLTRSESASGSVVLATPGDPLSLSSLAETVTVNGRAWRSNYTAATRQATLTTPVGRVTTVTYDALGRVTQMAPPGVQPLVLHYDARGRNDSVAQGARVTTLSYAAAGFLQSVVDPAQQTTSFASDPVGRPVRQTLPDLNTIALGYDANGNVTSVTPPGRPAHAFAFTPTDLESDYTPPGGPSFNTHTEYDLDQQMSSVSRPDGDFIAPTYDAVNGRLTALSTSRGKTAIGYSATTGQLTSVTTPDGVALTYGYDGSLLKDITWSGSVSGNVHKTYDSSFRVASESVTGGQTINFGYDNDDLLTTAAAMTITRDPATGFITATDLGAIHETRSYDAYGAEQHYAVTASGTTLYDVDYGTRDALGRIVIKTETIQGETHVHRYSYDANGRLTGVTTDGKATSHYEYDANGNRLVGPGLITSPVYDSQDRLLSYGACTYTYKNDGSLQTKTCPEGTTSYDYDAFGSLRGLVLPNGTVITYLIDGENRRVGKKINGVLVESFLYQDALRRVGWYDGQGALKAQFVFGSRANVPELMIRKGSIYRFVADQVGTVRCLTRFGTRDYDASVGRWAAPDPLNFRGGSTNLYVYADGDPVNRSDPNGLFTVSGCDKGDVPTADAVARELAASGIFGQDKALFSCILRQVYGTSTVVECSPQINIACVAGNREGRSMGGFAQLGSCGEPTHRVSWCHLESFKNNRCGAQALLHEFAHTCGWAHLDGKGVPGDSGAISCP